MMTPFREGDRARVERAARLLDEKRPGWFALIDLDDFCLASPCRCVLGQVYRERRWWLRRFVCDDGFSRGVADLRMTQHDDLCGVFAVDMFYREHWITAILSRRAATTPSATCKEPEEARQALSLVGVGIEP